MLVCLAPTLHHRCRTAFCAAMLVAFGQAADPGSVNAVPNDGGRDSAPASDAANAIPVAGRPTPRPLKRLENPYVRLPAVKLDAAAPASATPAAANADLFVLPDITVTGKPVAAPSLPLVHVPSPVRSVPASPFETPAARRERLLKTHFTPLERALESRTTLVAEAERLENAMQLNDVAALLELSAVAGVDDPAEARRLRAEYLKLFYSRPR